LYCFCLCQPLERFGAARFYVSEMEDAMESKGDEVCDFIETFLSLNASHFGMPFEVLPFQRDIINDIYQVDENGKRKHRTYLLGLSRKSAKSTLMAACGLYHLIADKADKSPLVIGAAASRDQARLIFQMARDMVSLSPDLSEVCTVYRSEIKCHLNNGTFKVVSADAGLQMGLNPSCILIDEFHVHKNMELYDALTLGSATRNEPLTLVISTAGYDLDSPLGELYRYGRQVESGEVDDPSFGFTWWGVPDNLEVDQADPEVWRRYNPAFDHFMNHDEMESAQLRTHEAAFRRYRLNGWTAAETQWLPNGVFEGLTSERRLEPGERIVLGFDGAWQNDSTALVACSIDEPRHLEVIGLWEKPDGKHGMGWRTPTAEVMDTILEAFDRFTVVELAADPWKAEMMLQEIADRGHPVVEFSTNSTQRMTQATQLAYDAIIDGKITHDGNPALLRHFSNAQLKEDPKRGSRLTKDRRGSTKKIDLAISSIIALHRASFWRDQTPAEVQLLVL
jgi:phage terminase large subunit-like protein